MTYSYTQISQYLTCPRRYRHRYLEGWKEKDTRAAMLFGRAFEQALGAYFRREDPGYVLFREWSACKDQNLHFSNHDTWDRMLEQGIMLLTRFCQDDRVRIYQPRRNLQVKFTRPMAKNEFVAYIDGIGKLDGTRCLLEWKTSSSRYPEEPEGLQALDPQMICYSWITGIAEDSIRRIESADFPPHRGIRFPQNPCSTCPYLGLCLGKQELVDAALVRRPGAENLGWLDELNY
jgi:hypothetical protein